MGASRALIATLGRLGLQASVLPPRPQQEGGSNPGCLRGRPGG